MAKKRTKYFFDYTLLLVVFALLIFGMLMIFSTSSYEASMQGHSAYFYLRKQIVAVGIGLGAMFIIIFMKSYYWMRSKVILGTAVIGSVILMLLLFSPLAFSANGATRWLDLKIVNLQPAEVVKLFMIVFLAGFIANGPGRLRDWKGIGVAMGVPGALAILIWQISDNLSSAIIVLGIAGVVVFVSTKNYKWYLLGILVVALFAGGYVLLTIYQSKNDVAIDFRQDRIIAWLDPESYSSDTGYQTLQSLYAIGSGGILGKGIGESVQKLGFIPEAQNDMIFSIICEELGLVGALVVMALFALLIYRCLLIAVNANDLYSALLVVGVMAHIAIQVVLNIAVVTNSIPNTGISLPFISYGGSSVVFLLCEIGIVLRVSRSIKVEE